MDERHEQTQSCTAAVPSSISGAWDDAARAQLALERTTGERLTYRQVGGGEAGALLWGH